MSDCLIMFYMPSDISEALSYLTVTCLDHTLQSAQGPTEASVRVQAAALYSNRAACSLVSDHICMM